MSPLGPRQFRRALHEFGYIEGQNIATVYRHTEGKPDRLPELAAELVRLNVDIIVVAGGYGPILAAKNATKTIPIVMVGAGFDPVEAGLVDSLARPGRQRHRDHKLFNRTWRKAVGAAQGSLSQITRVAVLYAAIPSV